MFILNLTGHHLVCGYTENALEHALVSLYVNDIADGTVSEIRLKDCLMEVCHQQTIRVQIGASGLGIS